MKKISVRLIATILICALCPLTACGTSPRAQGTTEKTVYLTFDDGPSPITQIILDVLKEQNVSATFFVVGEQAKKYPDILKRIHREGHLIGVHSQTHDYKKIYQSTTTLLGDIEECRLTLSSILGGFDNTVYRFPGGSFGLREEFLAAVKNAGYTHYDWNASNLDAELKKPDSSQLYNGAVTTGADRAGIVMLMHDASSKRLTAEALPDIIGYYKNKGYRFKPLPQKKEFL